MAIDHRAHRPGIRLVQMPDLQRQEIHPPDAAALAPQAHGLSHERLPHKPLPPTPPNLPIAPHPAHHPARRILHRWQPPDVSPPLCPVKLRRHSLVQRFVRSLLVVTFQPHARAVLLPLARGRGRLDRLPLEHPVKLFVRTVVFGMARARELAKPT